MTGILLQHKETIMRPEFLNFVDMAYVDQLQTDIIYSLDILDKVGPYGFDDELLNLILGNSDASLQDLADRFRLELMKIQRELLAVQNLIITEDCEFHKATLLLEAFWVLQNLNDFTDIDRILESELQKDEMLYEVFKTLVPITIDELFESVSEFKPELKSVLKDYIKEKIRSSPEFTPYTEEEQNILNNYKLFMEYVQGRYCLGNDLLEQGWRPGFTYSQILPFINNSEINSDNKKAALDVMSALLLCSDGYKDVRGVFLANSDDILDGFNDFNAISNILLKAVLEFDSFKKVKANEKK